MIDRIKILFKACWSHNWVKEVLYCGFSGKIEQRICQKCGKIQRKEHSIFTGEGWWSTIGRTPEGKRQKIIDKILE